MIQLNFDKNTRTLFVKEKGLVNYNDKKKYLSEALSFLKIYKKIKILQDSRDINFSSTPEEVEDFKKFVTDKIETEHTIYHAVIYSKPKYVAYSIIYEKSKSADRNYNHKIFSTMKAAKEWLKDFKI